MPSLEAQPAQYLYLQTKAYKEKRRAEPAMQTNVANLSDRDLRDIAGWLAAQRPVSAAYQLEPGQGRARKDEGGAARMLDVSCQGAARRLSGREAPPWNGSRSAPATLLNDQEMEGLAQFFGSLE